MFLYRFLIIIIVLFCSNSCLLAQPSINGKVLDAKTSLPIPFAVVKNVGVTAVTSSDSIGIFRLLADSSDDYSKAQTIITSCVGYKTDTTVAPVFKFQNIFLLPIIELKGVTITEKGLGTLHSTIKTINSEIIGDGELKKAACCNLSESFETNASVDVTMNDGVSGAKQISMIGLDGVYTQVLLENTPYVRALSSSYGLNFIPGSWIESIDISKGTGSVVNGYEALSGIVNVELQKPDKANKLLVNIYASSAGRAETNISYQLKINEKWNYLLMAHHSRVLMINDFNKDGFIDIPLSVQYNVFNRIKYNGKRFLFQAGTQLIDDDKKAGQIWGGLLGFPKTYQIMIHNRQGMFFTKTAFNFLNSPYRSIGLITNGKMQEQQSEFGNKTYVAVYNSFYSNLIFQDIIGDSRHKYKVGATYLYDHFIENYNDSSFSRIDNMPGAFAEYNFDNLSKFSSIVGFRVDNHPKYGVFYTPKINLKYRAHKNTTLRFSAGLGTRISNVFMDNTGLFANARKVVVLEKPLPEKGYSVGINLLQKFKAFGKDAEFVLDIYRSGFSNQVVIDFYESYKNVFIYNLKGKSYANALQAEVSMHLNEFFTVKGAYKFYKIETKYLSSTQAKPMIPTSRALFNISYTSKFDIWKADASFRYNGVSRLPVGNSHSNPEMKQTIGKAFITAYMQLTKAFKKMEVYVGCENLLNYLQPNAIVSANKPFSDTFDATMIYGPVTGRIIYTGLRYNIK